MRQGSADPAGFSSIPRDGSPIRRGRSQRLIWIIVVLALLPVAGLYLAHVLGAPDAATGFLQYDQAYYMANARKHFDQGFSLLYGLPFSPDYNTPRVYGQPQSLVLGTLLRLTGMDPGVVYVAFGLIAALACLRLAIALFDRLAPRRGFAGHLVLMLVLWGGGAVVLSRVVMGWLSGVRWTAVRTSLFAYDPSIGWWFLNFGRTLIMPLEAYYHALFFATILLLLGRRWAAGLALLALTSVSHPFTGLELLLVVSAWVGLERLVVRQSQPPLWFAGGVGVLFALHLGYYLWLLNLLSPEHRILQTQWSLDWGAKWYQQLACWGPAAGLAGLRLRSRSRIVAAWRDPAFRLLLAWFLAAFALVNHDLVIKPMQPLHFSRGYVWLPLMLMGAPALVELLERLQSGWRWAVGAGLAVLLLLDNGVWFTLNGLSYLRGERPGWAMLMPPNGRAMAKRLNQPDAAGRLLLADDCDLAYLMLVYTPLRTWASHTFNTLDRPGRLRELNALFHDGVELTAWRTRPLAALADKRTNPDVVPRLQGLGFTLVQENTTYALLFRDRQD